MRKVLTLNTTQDDNVLLGPPRTTQPFKLTIWLWEPAS